MERKETLESPYPKKKKNLESEAMVGTGEGFCSRLSTARTEEEELGRSIYFWVDTLEGKTKWFRFVVSSNCGFQYSMESSNDERLVKVCYHDADKEKEIGTREIFPFMITEAIPEFYSCVTLGSSFYRFGGDGIVSDDVQYFNLHTPEGEAVRMQHRRPMIVERADPYAVVLDGKVYVLGGIFADEDEEFAEDFGNGEVYDPILDEWERLRSGPKPYCKLSSLIRRNFFCAARDLHDSKDIIVGFYGSDVSFRYDVLEKKWDYDYVGPNMKGIIWSSSSVCRPILVGETLYWFDLSSCKIYAYDLKKTKWFKPSDCICGLEKDDVLNNSDELFMKPTLHHLGGEQFCLLWLSAVEVLNSLFDLFHCGKIRVVLHDSEPEGHLIAYLESCQSHHTEFSAGLRGGLLLNGKFSGETNLGDESAPKQIAGRTARIVHLGADGEIWR